MEKKQKNKRWERVEEKSDFFLFTSCFLFFFFINAFYCKTGVFFAIRAKITTDYKSSLKCHEDAEFA